MANGDRPHFEIPEDRVHSDLVTKTGFGTTVERSDYRAHGELLVRRTQEFRRASARMLDSEVASSRFLQVRTPEGIPVKGEKPRLKTIGIEVVAYSKLDPSAAMARVQPEVLDELEGRLLEYARTPDHTGRSYFSAIEDISDIPVGEKLAEALTERPDDEIVDCIVYVQAGLREREQDAILRQIQAYTEEHEGAFADSHRFRAGFATARVRIRSGRLEGLGSSFNTIREIRPNRAYFVEDATPIGPLPEAVRVARPTHATAVAVVDSGIQPRCAAVTPTVLGSINSLPPGAVAPLFDHGTFVASRVLYGDDLELQLSQGLLQPRCWLVDIPVFGRGQSGADQDIDEHHLAAALDSALPQLPAHVRTVNLSVGTDEPIKDNEFSLVATTIDHLARERDILVVTTAGNIRDRNLVASYPATTMDPRCRVDPPGEALLALTVGSIAHYADPSTQAGPREVSPFSRVGPGADGGRKPEVVAHGGNYVRPGRPISRFGVQGIFADGQQIAWDNGTSFAAPLVAAGAAQLFDTYPNAESNLVKALLCHYTLPAVPPSGHPDPCQCVGLGEPNVEAAISAGPFSGSFLYVGELDATRYKFLPFWVPAALSESGRGKLRIRGTVVWNPPVNPVNQQEYSQARVSINLRKPAEVGFADVPLTGCTPSYYQWNPLIHFDKVLHRQYNVGEWELRLRLWTRDLPTTYRQRFAAIIEIRDDNEGVDVWQEIKQEVGERYGNVALNIAA